MNTFKIHNDTVFSDSLVYQVLTEYQSAEPVLVEQANMATAGNSTANTGKEHDLGQQSEG
ncbi:MULTISPECIES: hypothetical protein [unclassified Endozoicomonas]|uniref:hypothetical protein n=1 Tax=unclassified Endozoicomonas TaxID=2644528 RepID=UPI003BB80500